MDRGLPKADLMDRHGERATKPSRKPRGYCIKLKAQHDFVFVERTVYDRSYTNGKRYYRAFDHFRCLGCGKKKTVDVTPKEKPC